ncbi:hypothetical protein GWI33_007334 [Rhynchophorus ferrugineus]|uniref:Uncharacterized protein n=1 Tax=Rhynchophorus ferrugineus TaxID=354439 RepID=A0A834IDS3_RHYFE|nr:hypothetical protein GWI33_007334 [Rhynchophorus ferrugineus]
MYLVRKTETTFSLTVRAVCRNNVPPNGISEQKSDKSFTTSRNETEAPIKSNGEVGRWFENKQMQRKTALIS